MRSDLYQNYLNILNSSEPNPSFAEIRELVTGERPARKPLLSPFFRYAFSAVVLLAIVGLAGYYFASARSSQFASIRRIGFQTRAVAPNRSSTSSSIPILQYTQARYSMTGKHASVRSSNEEPIVGTTPDTTLSAVIPLQEPDPAMQTAHPISPVVLHEGGALASASTTRWAAFLSFGTVINKPSMISSPLDGAAGLYYVVSSHSAFVVELRETVFPRTGGESNSTLRDTTVNLDGQSFHNSIGSTTLTSVQQLERIASLDIGYRYVLLPDARFSPIAEISGGVNTTGLLASIDAGIQFDISSGTSIGISAREVQLYARSSAPLGALEIESRLAYAW